MHTLVLLSVIVACATAKPLDQLVTLTRDTLGNFNLKLAVDGISRVEHRDLHGNVVGEFAFFDKDGILRKTEFTSGVHGFIPVSRDIPQPVKDTPEVALAKAEHLAIHRAESARPLIPEFQDEVLRKLTIDDLPLLKSTKFVTVPIEIGAIPETQEVIVAKGQHLAAHAIARSDNILSSSGLELPLVKSSKFVIVPVEVGGVPAETPEVIEAKAEHFAAHAVARANNLLTIPEIPAVRSTKFITIPIQVGAISDTPEVIAAKIEHLTAHAVARNNHLLSV